MQVQLKEALKAYLAEHPHLTLTSVNRKILKIARKVLDALNPERWVNQGQKETHQIVLEPSGFAVKEFGKIVAQIPGSDVKEIFAFKRDRFMHDLSSPKLSSSEGSQKNNCSEIAK